MLDHDCVEFGLLTARMGDFIVKLTQGKIKQQEMRFKDKLSFIAFQIILRFQSYPQIIKSKL